MIEPNLSVQVEAVIAPICIQKGRLKVLIIKRAIAPFNNSWCFPSGLVEFHETLELASERLLEHITGLAGGVLKSVSCYSELDRYPESRVIGQLYTAYFKPNLIANLLVTWQASEAEWVDFVDERLSDLGFDHTAMVTRILQAIRIDCKLGLAAFELIPVKFTLTNLQQAFEAILDIELDKRNFRKKIENASFLKALPETKVGPHSEARLFTLNREVLSRDYLNQMKPII
ncbi:MAG: NUDIX hydrolase [Flexibacteraceae bacterium]